MLDLHHLPNIRDCKRLIKNFDVGTAVVIAVPSHQHKKINRFDGSSCNSIRTVLAKEIKNIRQCIDIPQSVVIKVIELNKEKYPVEFKK